MQTIRIAHSPPADYRPAITRANDALRDLAILTGDSDNRSTRTISEIAYRTIGQISIHARTV